MDNWPAGLPQNIAKDYEMTPRDGLLDDTEERNPTRNRTYPEWSLTCSMVITSAQLATFRTFFDDDIKQSGAFTAPWLETLGFTFYFCQFLETPSWESVKPGYWRLSMNLDVIAGVEVDSNDDPLIYPPEE